MQNNTIRFIPFLLLCLIFIISGCSNSNEAQGSEEKQNNKDKDTTADVREYESLNGTIELPANPERVLVAVQDYVGDVLALGVEPVGVAGWISETSPYHKDLIKGIENVGENREVDVEKAMSLNPDVILTYDPNMYDKLSKIAPTVVIPLDYGYHDRITEIGKVLNKQEEANKWIKTFESKAEEKKQALIDANKGDIKVAIVELSAKDIYLMGKTFGRGGQIIYELLELEAPKPVEEEAFKKGWASISEEMIPEILGEADHILLGVRGDAEKMESTITESSLWKRLPAVQSGNVHPYSVDALYYSDAIALEHQLDQITAMFLK
ncbi:ABC transporter substrate-binding protein [Pontibacillus litoralis]|uniref:Ferrichrome-binding protein n=1 Tax=Pontibacillus litoralis JSM 072002 TaxID=1385512 RepID=A0A0A5GAI4_9BACI|nr:ABC transporter substrate-binding protein [Pontibacillus litoralis]KGX88213.1 ferrichrome-binding protein [Pontibacillus litoralis JSM 072002]